jgi:hypothetical protein
VGTQGALMRGRAARCAFWLTFHYGGRGDLAQAGGWFGRANRLLEHEPQECAEHGYLLVSTAYQHLMAGGHAEAREMVANAVGIGARAGDPDLVAFAFQLTRSPGPRPGSRPTRR